METMQKTGLYQKILQVMKDVEYLQKDDSVKYKEVNYKAISEEKVTSAVRSSLVKNGLIVLPVDQEHTKEGMLTTVNTKYKIIDVDTGESEIIVSSGTGVDTQDKGVGKAMTYSYKYLFLRAFAIPTGDDPDKISSAQLDKELEDEEKKQSNALVKTEKQISALVKRLNMPEEQQFELHQKYNGDQQKILQALEYLANKRTA